MYSPGSSCVHGLPSLFPIVPHALNYLMPMEIGALQASLLLLLNMIIITIIVISIIIINHLHRVSRSPVVMHCVCVLCRADRKDHATHSTAASAQ